MLSGEISHDKKLVTLVEGDPKAPFSIATTPRCRGRFSFPWIATLYSWYVPYIAECKARRYQVWFFKVFGINPGLSDHLANSLPTRPISRLIRLAVRVFAKGPGDWDSVPDRVISKTQKWYLMPPCLTLSIIRYWSRVKWGNPGKGVVPFPTPRCSGYWKGSLRVSHDLGHQLYLSYKFSKFLLSLE